MNNSKKKWLVLLVAVVVTLAAVTLASCNLFGPGDRPERIEILAYSGLLPTDVTEDTITDYIGVQYYDKTGNGNMLAPSQYTITSFNKTENYVYVSVSYNGLTADAQFGFFDDGPPKEEQICIRFEHESSVDISDQHIFNGERITEPNPPFRSDAVFVAWYATENFTGEPWDFSTPINTTNTFFTLYAKWERIVTLNFYDAYSQLYDTHQVNVLDTNQTVPNPDGPDKENYAFDSWYVNSGNDNMWEWFPENIYFLDPAIRTLNLYPKYLATFKVAFETNGGSEVQPIAVKDNEEFTPPQDVTKNGYELVCWSWNNPHYNSSVRSIFTEGALQEKTDDFPVGFEAGATVTIYAEWYSKNEPTQGLYFKDYVNADGITESDKCVVSSDTSHTQGVDFNTIEKTAFAIVIPETYNGKTVVGIEMDALNNGPFYSNRNLIVVVIPDTVTFICNGAFRSCDNLRDVYMPSSLKTVGENAFRECYQMDCVLPDGLTSIGNYAFYHTAFSGSLPSTLKSIGSYAFAGSRNNVTGNIGAHVTDIVLPEGLTELGDYAFQNCINLTSVTLNGFIGQAGVGAFADCAKLTDVFIPEGVEILPDKLFYGCSSLTEITLPSTLKHIGDRVFCSTALTSVTLPSGLLSIGEASFYKTRIIELIIPNGVTEISSNAFGDSDLKQVTLPQRLAIIGDKAFYGSELESVEIPSSVHTIGSYAFSYTNLTAVNLNSVRTLGDYAFANCGKLVAVTMSNKLETIGDRVFNGTKADFGNLVLPRTVKSIGASAFTGCKITSIEIDSAEGLTIADSAFKYTEFVSASLHNVISMGKEVFFGNSRLENVSLSGSFSEIGKNTFAETSLKTLAYGGDVNDWLKVKLNDTVIADLGVKVTLNGQELTGAVTVAPKTSGEVITINAYAFQGFNKITSITLEGVLSIGERAFYGCSELSKVTFGAFADGVVNIERNAFEDCSKLQYNEYNKGLYLGGEQERYLVYIKPTDADINKLELNAGAKVVANSALRYESYPNLSVVTLNDGLSYIGDYAFYGCGGVTELVVPDSVDRIGKGAFQGWSSLSRLTVPFVGDRRYADATDRQLKWIFGDESSNVPSSLIYVKVTGDIIIKNAFEGCTELTELDAGETSRVLIGALYGCSKLEKLVVPAGITYSEPTGEQRASLSVAGYFSQSGGSTSSAPQTLKELIITGGLISSGIVNNTSLEKVTLSKTITEIEMYAFNRCSTLTEIYFEGTTTEWENITKHSDWAKETSVKTIHCSNGDIAL